MVAVDKANRQSISPVVGGEVLRDTVIYCAAEKYGLDALKRLALRKQGLQSGIQVDVISKIRSGYAYDRTRRV